MEMEHHRPLGAIVLSLGNCPMGASGDTERILLCPTESDRLGDENVYVYS